MLKMKSVLSPLLDATGAFTQSFGEFGAIASEAVSQLCNGTSASGQAIILLASTTGFAVGQTVLIKDNAGSETGVIITVTPATPSITISANLVNSYTVARGASVTVTGGVSLPLSGTCTASATVLLAGGTAGMLVGQVVQVKDTGGSEVGTIITVNAGVSIVLAVALTGTYTVARGATVTVISATQAKVSVELSMPYTNATGVFVANLSYAVKWAAVGNLVYVMLLVYTVATWTVPTAANIAGVVVSITVDGE